MKIIDNKLLMNSNEEMSALKLNAVKATKQTTKLLSG